MNRLLGARFRDWAIVVAALCCIVVVAIQTERRHAPNPVTYSTYEASPAGLRAWYEMLGREGVTVTRFEERAAFLDRNVGTLVIVDPPFFPLAADLPQADIVPIAAWVRAGGRLVAVGDGLAMLMLHNDLKMPKTIVAKHGLSATRFIAPELRSAGVSRVWEPVVGRLVARPHDTVLLGDASGALVLRYRYGRGVVVDAIDAAAFSNEHIGTPDHARLAFALVRPPDARGPTAFDEAMHGYLAPEHWWVVLPRRFVVAVLLACAALAIAIVGAAVRLGPPLRPIEDRSATSAEYLDAVAALYERRRAAGKALGDAFASTRRIVAAAAGVPHDARIETIAARIARPELRAALLEFDAVAMKDEPDESGLVRGLALAHVLRKELAHDRGR